MTIEALALYNDLVKNDDEDSISYRKVLESRGWWKPDTSIVRRENHFRVAEAKSKWRVVTDVFPTLQGTKYAEILDFKVHGNQVVQRMARVLITGHEPFFER